MPKRRVRLMEEREENRDRRPQPAEPAAVPQVELLTATPAVFADPRLDHPANGKWRAQRLQALQRQAGNAALQELQSRSPLPDNRSRSVAPGQDRQHDEPTVSLPTVQRRPPASQPSIQRRPLRAAQIRNADLGALEVISTLELVEMRATTEVVPVGDQPQQFRGFPTQHEALSMALLQSGVTAIVRDPDDMFHVLQVQYDSPISEETRSLPTSGGEAFTPVRFVNPAIPIPAVAIHGEAPDRPEYTWEGRVQQARDLHTRFYGGETGLRDELAQAYRRLAAEAFHVAPDQIHIRFRLRDTIDADRINIMLDPADQAGGRSGIGEQLPPPGERVHEFGLYPTRPAAEQRGWMQVSWTQFLESGPDEARQTFRHEASHEATTERVRQLMETWQGLGRPEGDFWMWLRAQRRLRGGGPHRVTQADVEMALARLYTQSDEPLAVAMEFTASYHMVPADQITDQTFRPLGYMLTHWPSAGSGMGRVRSLRDDAMRRLRVYYREHLDAAHQDAFDRWVDGRPRSGGPIRSNVVGSASWSDESVQDALTAMRGFRRGRRRRR